jgi:electron transfer flavoprotein alpha subunit
MNILVIAEHNNQNLHNSTQHTISASHELPGAIHVLVAGYNCKTVAQQAAQQEHVKKVLYADDVIYQHGLAEDLAQLIVTLAPDYAYILAPATTFGKNVLPRAAALLDVGQISDIIQIINAETFMRPIYAGNALATITSNDPIKIITVRPTAFPLCAANNTSSEIQSTTASKPIQLSEFISLAATPSGTRPDLSAARVVIAGGRGLQTKENFALLEILANKLNAALGASRAAVDAGLVPNDLQIGQTGKVVAPELYIAIGISGAIQHMAGMKDSKVIVAINSDPDAPIFQIADYGLVADLFVAVPELINAL